MKLQDFVAFGILIIIFGLLFFLTTPKTPKLGNFDGENINFMAGETFTLTIDRGATTDTEISQMNIESNNYPFSENWNDFGADGVADRKEVTDPEKFTDTKNTKNGKWDKGEKFIDTNGNGKWDGALAYDRQTNPDPHGDNYSKNNPTGTEGNDEWDKGEKFIDVDGDQAWTPYLLEFRWEKIISYKSGRYYKRFQTIPLTPLEDKPYVLEYEGTDVGELNIRLTVFDKRSSFRNEYPVLASETFSFFCNKIMEQAPIIKGQPAECCDKVF